MVFHGVRADIELLCHRLDRQVQVVAQANRGTHPRRQVADGLPERHRVVGRRSRMLGDGRRFTVRPEKIFLVENGAAPKWLHVEEGTIKDVSYAWMVTRYMVELEAGGELQVVRQNLETSSDEAQAHRGRKVKIGWRADQTVAVEGEEEGK